MKFVQHIPNTITVLNLVSGMMSLIMTMEGAYAPAAFFIFLAAVFDFFDGMSARLLKAYSDLGKQLDSLADVVSFGVAPGLMMFRMISVPVEGAVNILEQLHVTPYFALMIPVCSALRLAKFNIDLRQEVHFIGLPTPANAIFFASIPLVLYVQPGMSSLVSLPVFVDFFSNTRVMAILSVFFSYLLISDFRIFSLKFKSTGWKGNQLQYTLIGISALLFILFSLNALPLIIIVYVLMSVLFQGRITG